MKMKLTWEIEHKGKKYTNGLASSDFGDADINVAKNVLMEVIEVFAKHAEMSMSAIVYGELAAQELEKRANKTFKKMGSSH